MVLLEDIYHVQCVRQESIILITPGMAIVTLVKHKLSPHYQVQQLVKVVPNTLYLLLVLRDAFVKKVITPHI